MEVSPLNERFKIRATRQATKPGCWDYNRCEVMDGETVIGEYTYKYSGTPPFHVFEQNGKIYALYAEDYTATSVMSIPSCEKVASEPAKLWGFCPTGFAVPYGNYCYPIKEEGQKSLTYVEKPFNGQFGFICGCVWGDDSSWKIQYLDLSEIEDGVIKREARMGYIELLGGAETLKDAIDIYDWEPENHHVVIAAAQHFNLLENKE